MLPEYYMTTVNNQQQPDNKPGSLLGGIKLAERFQEKQKLTQEEWKEILLVNLREYAEGREEQDFIIRLGSIVYIEGAIFSKDGNFIKSAGMIKDLLFKSRGEKVSFSDKDKVLRSALKILEE